MKNHRFLWLRNRTTNNRKCEKARNIKEKRTIEMFNQVLKQLVEHHSSQRDNLCLYAFFSLCSLQGLFSFATQWYPHSLAVAVKAKNSPPDCFLYAFTVLKEIIFVILAFYSLCNLQRLFSFAPQWYPHSLAIAVKAKNSPPDCFLYAFTVLKEIIFVILAFYSLCSLQGLFCFIKYFFWSFLMLGIN